MATSSPFLTTSEPSVIQAAAVIATEHIEANGSISLEKLNEITQDMINIDDHVKTNFPGALPGSQILEKTANVIEKFGLNADNTLYAQSVCPDEINHEVGDITNLFSTHLGEVFHLGGLAGIPFTGVTGFKAFSGHVPDGGHLFILQAPHIGLSSSGEFGRYSRDGKDNDDAACGAACGAFSHCLAQSKLKKNNTSNNKDNIEDRKEDDPNDDANVYDYQMQYIINEINKVCLKIDSENKIENDKQVCLVIETHRIGKNMLDHCIAPHFDGGGHMVVLTGIQINMPRPFDDYFCPLTFELIKKDGTVIDLMSGFKKSSSNQNRNKLQKVPSMNILSASSGDDEKSTNNSESEKDRKEKRNSFFNIFS